jgi:hypothetical protein
LARNDANIDSGSDSNRVEEAVAIAGFSKSARSESHDLFDLKVGGGSLKAGEGLKGPANRGRIEFAVEKEVLPKANHQLLTVKLADAVTRANLVDIKTNGISAEIDNPYTQDVSLISLLGLSRLVSRGKRFFSSL